MKKYNWLEDCDKHGNSIWTLISPYEERFAFNLCQKLEGNQIWWCEAHDAELMGDAPLSWTDLNEAKKEIEKCYENILSDNSY